MESVKHVLARAALVFALVVPVSVIGAQAANAAVWNCSSYITTKDNSAYAVCNSGVGSYRVVATCYSPSWPYTKTLYGPYISRTTYSGNGARSSVWGDSSGCHISSARYDAR